MRTSRIGILVVLGLLLGPSPAGARERLDPTRTTPTAEGSAPEQVIVSYRSGSAAAARSRARAAAGAVARRPLPGVPGRAEVLELRGGVPATRVARALSGRTGVAWAEPNRRWRLSGVPNDPRLGEQWALRNTGQPILGVLGSPGADIRASAAWSLTRGSGRVIVAVVDSGVAWRHPDLAPSIWSNTGEVAGNGVDDDRNGYVDDVRGYDVWDKDPDPSDPVGHGTHIAGTIGAVGDNAIGVSGVAQRVRLMPVRVTDRFGSLTTVEVVEGFTYAAANGARIVNASFGGEGRSRAVEAVVRRYPDTLFFVPAGNERLNVDAQPTYPCALTEPNIVCVAASDQRDRLSAFSSYGDRTVDLAAPGESILGPSPHTATAFADDIEDGGARWQFEGTFAASPEARSQGALALSDSPGGPYAVNTTSTATLRDGLDLRGGEGCVLRTRADIDIDPDDTFMIEASADGVGWQQLAEYTNVTSRDDLAVAQFVSLPTDLATETTNFDGRTGVRVRYAVRADGTPEGADGVHLDEIAVECQANGGFSGSDYGYRDGTSFAAPHAAGVAALIADHIPGDGPERIVERLTGGADAVTGLRGRTASGRLDARASLDTRGPTARARLTISRARTLAAGRRIRLPIRVSEAAKARVRIKLRVGSRLLTVGRTAHATWDRRRTRRLSLRLTRLGRVRVRRELSRRGRVRLELHLDATDAVGNRNRRRIDRLTLRR
ncbi:MAG: S8 family serine peptidase [Solirubrobacterales bacterium]